MSALRSNSVAAAVVVVTVVIGGLVAHFARAGNDRDTDLERALTTLPSSTLVANFTDWAGARTADGHHTGPDSTTRAKRRFLDRAYARDFSALSVLSVFTSTMQTSYGWSVLDSQWEMYGQSKAGSVDVLSMSADFDFTRAAHRLDKLGYPKPDGHGVRAGGVSVEVTAGLTPQLGNIALLPEDGLIVLSDDPGYAGRTVSTIRGDRSSVLDEPGVADMARHTARRAVAAVVDVGHRACVSAGRSTAGAGARRRAAERVSEAGGIHRINGLTLALAPTGSLWVVMHFPSESQARADVTARKHLAHGAAPVQGGTFDERFSVHHVAVDGANLTMRLEPKQSHRQLLSDLQRGGLLFAGCS
ncbi:MAG: hypothetical protein ACRDQA_01705 [Nocardioidaceae bacterium]